VPCAWRGVVCVAETEAKEGGKARCGVVWCGGGALWMAPTCGRFCWATGRPRRSPLPAQTPVSRDREGEGRGGHGGRGKGKSRASDATRFSHARFTPTRRDEACASFPHAPTTPTATYPDPFTSPPTPMLRARTQVRVQLLLVQVVRRRLHGRQVLPRHRRQRRRRQRWTNNGTACESGTLRDEGPGSDGGKHSYRRIGRRGRRRRGACRASTPCAAKRHAIGQKSGAMQECIHGGENPLRGWTRMTRRGSCGERRDTPAASG